MISVATVLMLAALAGPPVPLEPALGAIVKAQAAQAAARAYRVMRRSTDPKGDATVAVSFVSPDRYHARWESSRGDEIIRIGERGWWNMGQGGRWELEPRFTSTSMLRRLRGPATADDWAFELRDARALGARELNGVRTEGYQYTLATTSTTSHVRVWVAAATGLPVRYENDNEDGEKVSWDVAYDANVRVEPPKGEAPPATTNASTRPANYPRLTLPAAGSAPALEDEDAVRRLPAVVMRGDVEVRVGARQAQGPAAVEAALRGALREGPAQQDEFLLYAGDDVKWSSIERLLDAASAAGSTRVSLGVRSDSGRESVLRARIRTTPVPSTALPSHLVAWPVSGSGPTQVISLNGIDRGVGSFQILDILETRSDRLIDVVADGAQAYQDVVSLIDILAAGRGEVVLTTSSKARRFLKAPLPPPPPPPSRERGDVLREGGGAGQETRLRGVRVGGDIKEPAKLHDVRPVYPGIAREAGVQGAITLECKISPEGRVTDVEVLRGIPLLDQSAIDAVKEWRYAPTLVKGVPVSVILTVTVNFELTPPTPRPKRNLR